MMGILLFTAEREGVSVKRKKFLMVFVLEREKGLFVQYRKNIYFCEDESILEYENEKTDEKGTQ